MSVTLYPLPSTLYPPPSTLYPTPTQERDAIVSMDCNPRTWHLAVLSWVLSDASAARRSGLLVGGSGLETSVLQAATGLRSAVMTIPDELVARSMRARARAQATPRAAARDTGAHASARAAHVHVEDDPPVAATALRAAAANAPRPTGCASALASLGVSQCRWPMSTSCRCSSTCSA